MNSERRDVLKSGIGAITLGVLAAAGLIAPGRALAEWNKAAFEARSLREALKALGAVAPAASRDIVLSAPEIAENGAAVDIGIVSTLPEVVQVAILVEKNPGVLAASFSLPEGTPADLQTRIKMAESSQVFVLVKAGGKFFMTSKEVRVTLGGCAA